MSTSRGEGTFQRKKKKVEKLAWPQRLAMSIDDELDVSNQVHRDRVGTDHTGAVRFTQETAATWTLL